MRFLMIFSLLLGSPVGPRWLVGKVLEKGSTIEVTVSVQDGSGGPVKNDLVILQDLDDHEKEIVRALTDLDGRIPPLRLGPGLYRAIATAPYGLWQTRVSEFLVQDIPVNLIVAVEPMPTHGAGDVVTVETKRTNLRIVAADGHPASGAIILAHDAYATPYLERWYKADQFGKTEIEITADPQIIVVVFGGMILTREVASHSAQQFIRLAQQ